MSLPCLHKEAVSPDKNPKGCRFTESGVSIGDRFSYETGFWVHVRPLCAREDLHAEPYAPDLHHASLARLAQRSIPT